MKTTAIETEYAGHRFRSRLEARWAVFFDHLGIKWLYEPQGYTLGNGERYLPDFWLPTWGVWVEVKGKLTDADAGRIIAAADLDGLPIDYLCGVTPAGVGLNSNQWRMTESLPRVLILGEIPPAHEGGWGHPVLILAAGNVMETTAVIRGNKGDWVFDLVPVGPFGSPYGMHARGANGLPLKFVSVAGAVLDAYGAGRKARFEHGESGYLKPALKDAWPEPARPAKQRFHDLPENVLMGGMKAIVDGAKNADGTERALTQEEVERYEQLEARLEAERQRKAIKR